MTVRKSTQLRSIASSLSRILPKHQNFQFESFRTAITSRKLTSNAISELSKKIELRQNLSLEEFNHDYYQRNKPVVIRGEMEDWPARKWTPQTVKHRFGKHVAPVELARWHPLYQRWGDYRDLYRSQTQGQGSAMMEEYFTAGVPISLGDFIDIFIQPDDKEENLPVGEVVTGYLAQHQMLLEIPEMSADVIDPFYTSVAQEVYQRNIWMGPKGTSTPLHRDPYHNIFAQVWGSKSIRLYSPEQSHSLYPFEDSVLLRNTSQVDVDAANVSEKWPEFASEHFMGCTLEAGDMLFIPKKWWHYIKSVDTSLSFSFWWT